MTRTGKIVAAAAVAALTASGAMAWVRIDPATLDAASPSVTDYPGAGITTSDIYIWPDATQSTVGLDVDSVNGGPILHISGGTLSTGISLLTSSDAVDALSSGETVTAAPYLIYSVSRSSVGLPGTDIAHQSARGQQAADGYATLADAPVTAGSANPVGASGTLWFNQTRYNFIPTLAPVATNAGAQDDAVSLELNNLEPLNPASDNEADVPVYFSLKSGSPSLGTASASAADVFVTLPGLGGSVYATAAQLGLSTSDDLNAVAVWDGSTVGTVDTGDYALFSVAGSGDLFVSNFDGTNSVYMTAAELGLAVGDDLDAIDVSDVQVVAPDVVPEPASLAVLGLAAGALIRRRRA